MTKDEAAATAKSKTPKHRSPNYPYLGLKEALTKTELLRQTGGVHPVGLNSVMSAWGLKGEGTTSSVIAALKAFGLISVSGEGKHRQVVVSEAARKILIDHSDKSELLKKAALSPTLYAELWKRFGPELPPTDKPISEYMIFDRHFNERVVDAVIADFKATISFANLSESDKLEDNSDGEEDVYEEIDPPDETDSTKKKVRRQPPKDGEIVEELNFKLAPESNVALVFTSKQKVTQEDFGLLMRMLELQKMAFPTAKDVEIESTAEERSKRIVPEF